MKFCEIFSRKSAYIYIKREGILCVVFLFFVFEIALTHASESFCLFVKIYFLNDRGANAVIFIQHKRGVFSCSLITELGQSTLIGVELIGSF